MFTDDDKMLDMWDANQNGTTSRVFKWMDASIAAHTDMHSSRDAVEQMMTMPNCQQVFNTVSTFFLSVLSYQKHTRHALQGSKCSSMYRSMRVHTLLLGTTEQLSVVPCCILTHCQLPKTISASPHTEFEQHTSECPLAPNTSILVPDW